MYPNELGPMIYISNLRKFSDLIMTIEINWFFVHFSSYFAELNPSTTRKVWCPASGGIAFSIFFSRKHSPSENAGTPRFHSPFSDISFSLRVEIATISALSFRSLVPHSLGSPICVRVHHSGPTLIVDIGCRPNSPRSKYEVQVICFDYVCIWYFIPKLIDVCAYVVWIW